MKIKYLALLSAGIFTLSFGTVSSAEDIISIEETDIYEIEPPIVSSENIDLTLEQGYTNEAPTFGVEDIDLVPGEDVAEEIAENDILSDRTSDKECASCIEVFSDVTDTTCNAGMITGKCGSNAYYCLDTQKLTISGNGSMDDYMIFSPEISGTFNDYASQPWHSYRNSLRSIVIEEGITSIGNLAFAGFRNVQTIQLPDSLTRIGDWAFAYGNSIIEINKRLRFLWLQQS